jgi:hypothetical protein
MKDFQVNSCHVQASDRGMEYNVNAQVDWISFAVNLVSGLLFCHRAFSPSCNYCNRNLHTLIMLLLFLQRTGDKGIRKRERKRLSNFKKLARIISITDLTSAAPSVQFNFPAFVSCLWFSFALLLYNLTPVSSPSSSEQMQILTTTKLRQIVVETMQWVWQKTHLIEDQITIFRQHQVFGVREGETLVQAGERCLMH